MPKVKINQTHKSKSILSTDNCHDRQTVINKDEDWHQIHASGHGKGEKIGHIVKNSHGKSLIPAHTQHEEHHKQWHDNVNYVNQHDVVNL